jgi:hypothetical protein
MRRRILRRSLLLLRLRRTVLVLRLVLGLTLLGLSLLPVRMLLRLLPPGRGRHRTRLHLGLLRRLLAGRSRGRRIV